MEVRARHILVGSEEKAKELLEQLNSGKKFADLAMQFSKCPSGKKGGDLGSFKRGMMVPEFDRFCFTNKKGDKGIVKTQFGWHVIEINDIKK